MNAQNSLGCPSTSKSRTQIEGSWLEAWLAAWLGLGLCSRPVHPHSGTTLTILHTPLPESDKRGGAIAMPIEILLHRQFQSILPKSFLRGFLNSQEGMKDR